MTRIIARLLAIIFAVQAFAAPSVSAAETIEFDNLETSVTGRLLYYLGNGETGHALLLDKPITIEGNPKSKRRADKKTVENIQQIMVAFSSEKPQADTLGNVFVITGRISNESSDPRIQKILMIAESFLVIEEVEGNKPIGIIESHSR